MNQNKLPKKKLNPQLKIFFWFKGNFFVASKNKFASWYQGKMIFFQWFFFASYSTTKYLSFDAYVSFLSQKLVFVDTKRLALSRKWPPCTLQELVWYDWLIWFVIFDEWLRPTSGFHEGNEGVSWIVGVFYFELKFIERRINDFEKRIGFYRWGMEKQLVLPLLTLQELV